MNLYAEIVFSIPLNKTFLYIVPEIHQEKAKVGSRILAPFKQRLLTGIIINLKKKLPTENFKLKEIKEVLDDVPVFSPSFLKFTRKLSSYYYSSWGSILMASLPPSLIVKSKTTVMISEKGKKKINDDNLPEKEKKLLKFLRNKSYSSLFLKRKMGMDDVSGLISRLEKKGLLYVSEDIKKTKRKKQEGNVFPDQKQLEIDFSVDNNNYKKAAKVESQIDKNTYSQFLLYGPPQKRESFYFYLIKTVLALNKKVLYLTPEIIFTGAIMEKFETKLGRKAALLHSRLTERQRELEWRKIKKGEVDVVVGPRSALFSPLDHIGLIIVDEEQDESFYQKESPTYDTIVGARLRAKQEKAVVLYGSESPSIESFYRAKKKGFLLRLEEPKKGDTVEIVDSRKENELISNKLKQKIENRLSKREPVIVFSNQRGYSSYVYCSKCHFIPRCQRCDKALIYHKEENKLICHYCNYSVPFTDTCQKCKGKMLKKRGVGIERIEEELNNLFPHKRISFFASDKMKSIKEKDTIINEFKKGRIDILCGTRFLAHRIDLPKASLVAILYPETILSLPDFRASQITYQTLHKMLRFLQPGKGEAVVQTSFPDHFSIYEAVRNDYDSFFYREIGLRKVMNYPPFYSLAEILFFGKDLRSLAQNSRKFLSRLRKISEDKIDFFGPALAPVSRMKGINRIQVILKSKSKKDLDEVLNSNYYLIKSKKSIRFYH